MNSHSTKSDAKGNPPKTWVQTRRASSLPVNDLAHSSINAGMNHETQKLSTFQRMADSSQTVKQLQALQRLGDARNLPFQHAEAEGSRAAIRQPQAREGAAEDRSRQLPADLQVGIEYIAQMSLDDVRVHRNSGEPAKVGALAYARGRDIHLAAGEERHLPHEAWHIVQQAQGRVRPTIETNGMPVNDDQGLEHEADVQGAKAAQVGESLTSDNSAPLSTVPVTQQVSGQGAFQLQVAIDDRQQKIQQARDVIAQITSGGQPGDNATTDEIAAHDAVMDSGQHHGKRNVSRSQLIADLQRRIGDYSGFNTRDLAKKIKQRATTPHSFFVKTPVRSNARLPETSKYEQVGALLRKWDAGFTR